MSMLMRAPRECGSWLWDLEEAEPGLAPALAIAARMTELLDRYSLLTPARLDYGWYLPGQGRIGITTTLTLTVPLNDPALPERIMQSRPAGFPSAELGDLKVLGAGSWVDAEDREHREPGLVELVVDPAPVGLSAELSVHHDIWAWYDFAGRPHPEVQKRNAPRLAAALQALDQLLGTSAQPGEPTYFGSAEGHGIRTADPNPDGSGPDLTDML